MDATYRWYRIKVSGKPVSFQGLRRKLLREGTEEAWFSDAGSDELRFFRRGTVFVENYDKLGERSVQEVHVVSSMNIRAFEGGSSTLIRIKNPGRTIRPLFNILERSVGFGFSVTPVTFEGAQLAVIEKADVRKLVSLKVTDVVIGKDCLARMEFVSRDGLDVEKISFLRKLSYRKDLIKYELSFAGVKGVMTCSAGGAVKVSGGASERIVSLLERQLISES